MAEGARVDSIETLQSLKIALIKFAEAANVALADADGELRRTQMWLQTEARSHWDSELRKRTEALAKAKDALRQKKLYKDASGRFPSAVDEEKAVRLAQRNVEEAERKIAAVRKHTLAIQKEIQSYQGAAQRLANTVQIDVPMATAHLEKMFTQLQAYVSLRAGMPAGDATAGVSPGGGAPAPMDGSMARPAGWSSTPDIDPLELRRHSPTHQKRRLARAGDVSLVRWRIGSVSDSQRDSIQRIDLSVVPGQQEASLTLVVDREALERPHLYLERLDPTSETDSGWYLGPTDADPDVCQTIPIDDLLRTRPDLRELLSLPEGCLAVLGVNGLEIVFDRSDNKRWSGTV